VAWARIRGEVTELRPATDDDADLLVAWHNDEEVARYWDRKTFTRETMLARLARARVTPYIVEADGAPVGYLQVHDLDEDGDGGLDMFLLPGARGRGLGPDAARAMVRHLLDERGWTRVTVDPYAWNETAVRGWRNAGFVEISEHEADDEHLQPWVLMEFRG
jgi:aminoglycoside 6'-N-acetyltransferase